MLVAASLVQVSGQVTKHARTLGAVLFRDYVGLGLQVKVAVHLRNTYIPSPFSRVFPRLKCHEFLLLVLAWRVVKIMVTLPLNLMHLIKVPQKGP